MNERLTIRNPHFEIFTWLPIGRCDADHVHNLGGPMAKAGRAVMKAKRGNISAVRTIAADGFFSPQGRELKEDATSSALAEKDLAFYEKRFLLPHQDL